MMDGIAAFWAWWPEARSELEGAAGGGGGSEVLAGRISERVSAIQPELEWELGPGAAKPFMLCVTAAGNRIAREAAARWLLAAPEETSWEFHRARPAAAGGFVLQFGSGAVELSQLRLRIAERPEEELIDVIVDERSLRVFQPGERLNATFLILDQLLGEDDVERFLGEIAVQPVRWRAHGPDDLRAAIQRLAAARADREARGKALVAIMQGTNDGRPLVVTAHTSVRSVDHPLRSAHAAIAIELADPTDLGLTTDAEAEVQNALQDELEAALGASGLTVARETAEGRRVIHMYVDPLGEGPRLLREWCAACTTRKATVEVSSEPDWDSVTQFGVR
jgi:hypothetical protein